jgi:hypothetical protein
LLVLLAAISFSLLSSGLRAETAGVTKHFGLGLELGTPTLLTAKIWMDPVNAWDIGLGGLGYYYTGPDRVQRITGFVAHVDYLWHHYGVFSSRPVKGKEKDDADFYDKMPFYVGVGGVMATPDGFFGVRGVFGVTYLFDAPFDVFLEAAPTLGLTPVAGYGGVDLSLGGRFYF